MKYLQDYITDAQTELFNKHKGFFAFSNQAVSEKMKELNIDKKSDLVSLGAGLICPKTEAQALSDGLHEVYKTGIIKDMEENGKWNIIKRELANHEIVITGDITDTVEALTGYPITEQEVNLAWRGRRTDFDKLQIKDNASKDNTKNNTN